MAAGRWRDELRNLIPIAAGTRRTGEEDWRYYTPMNAGFEVTTAPEATWPRTNATMMSPILTCPEHWQPWEEMLVLA